MILAPKLNSFTSSVASACIDGATSSIPDILPRSVRYASASAKALFRRPIQETAASTTRIKLPFIKVFTRRFPACQPDAKEAAAYRNHIPGQTLGANVHAARGWLYLDGGQDF